LTVPNAGQHSARLVARQAPQVRTRVNDTRLDAPAGPLDRLLENFWEVCGTAGFLAQQQLFGQGWKLHSAAVRCGVAGTRRV
jgi:hypothetical protein